MFERRGRVAKAYPNPAHPMQQSRSAHLLSIRLEQHGLRSTPRRTSTWSSRNVVVFLSCRSTTQGPDDANQLVRCAIRPRIEPVGWQWTDPSASAPVRVKQRIWSKS